MINESASCFGKTFGHDYMGGRCMKCGQSQTGAPVQRGMKGMSELFKMPEAPKKNITSEMQALIDEIRTEFGETAVKGIGSFPFYGMFIKKTGIPFARQAFHQAKSSGTNARDPKRLFVWMLKEEIKRIKTKEGKREAHPSSFQ